jgi:predicted acetyltransferase
LSIIFKSMILRSLTIEDETDAVRAHALLAPEEFPFLFDFEPGDDFVAYVARVDAFNAGGQFSKGGVPGAFLIAEVDGAIVGRLSVRFELNDYLRLYGGHVGYCVLPEFRRRGYASGMLGEGLELLRQRGTASVLVTCDEDNAGSRAVIERAGGHFDKRVDGDGSGPKRHYWFETPNLGATASS